MTREEVENAILKKEPLAGSDLSFTAADMKYARFRKAKCTNAVMVTMNLFEAILEKADLSGADLSGSNLYGAGFLDSIIVDTKMKKTNLKKTLLENAV